MPHNKHILPIFTQRKTVNRRRAKVESLENRTLLSGGEIPPLPTAAARWAFDEGTGASAIDSSGNGQNATLGTGATWVSGNVGTNAMRLNGSSTAMATVTGAVVNTSGSFTVSAWVNFSQLGGFQTAVAICGNTVAGFYLQLRGDTGAFGFARLNSDANGGANVASASSAPVVNRWYHIVGVEDVSAGTLSLYVDGQLEGTAAHAGGWQANGNTIIGHGFYNGGLTDNFYGSIDEVTMYASALTAAQVAAMDRPAFYTFEEGSGVTTADMSGHGNTLSLNSGVAWTAGHLSTGAASLDGTANGNGSVASSVLDTSLPFSVSAWVRLNSLSGFQTFVSMDGTTTSGFYLQLRGDTGKFAFTRLASDSNSATAYHADATSAPTTNTWYHLLGISDRANGRIRLYVNGVLQSTVSTPAGWTATGSTFVGAGKYNGGRVDFVNGQVDDVIFYNSPLSESAAAMSPYVGGNPQSVIQIDTTGTGITISPDLFGAFMEDINYGGEGGVYNDQIRNGGFNDSTNALNAWSAISSAGVTASLTSDATTGPTSALAKSGKLTIGSGVGASQRAGIANTGFFGMAVAPSTTYQVEFYAAAPSTFSGSLTVSLESNTGTVYASAVIPSISSSWTKYTATLTTPADAPLSSTNRFVIATNHPSANGSTIWFGSVHLFPPSYKNSPAHLRVDLMEKLAAMKPAFFRVPGGNYLEGNTFADRFQWSKTIGLIENRPGHFNSAWGYWSSDGMGLDEYLQMAELIGSRPILAVYAGYTLNGSSDTGGVLTADVQDALDELHYVLDPVTTSWGALRAANGHPAPYDVQEVEIGNEGFFSSTYGTRYPLFYDAIHAEFPQLKIIASHTATGGRPYDMLDEHFYPSPATMQSRQDYYDSRARGSYKIIVGEYASMQGSPTNNMNAALGDATWLIGLQENSDLVTMSCYAPLWANVNGVQWTPDLIGYNNIGSYGSPSYYAQVMLANNHGTGVAPYTLGGASGLRATVSRTGDTYYLTVINLSSVARQTTVNLAGAAVVSPMGTMLQLAASSSSATNSITNPTTIVPITTGLTGLDTTFSYEYPPTSLTILKFYAGSAAPAITQVTSGGFEFESAQRIDFSFSGNISPVSINDEDLVLQNQDTLEVISAASIVASATDSSASFSFTDLPGSILPDGNYRATLQGGGVFDANGFAIDGDANSTPGGEYAFDFFVLQGDANRDRKVDTQDFNVLAANFGAANRTFSQGNFDLAGNVDSLDFNAFASRYGKRLAPPSTALPLGAANAIQGVAGGGLFADSLDLEGLIGSVL
jgi:alpha-L-arabinofuranosidase